ncbi:MAG TPA: hypothetical protein VFF91_07190 [Pseudoxanthomonas sp.]|nr:hypothetical protein [Pseudoxanthomonas sp.]
MNRAKAAAVAWLLALAAAGPAPATERPPLLGGLLAQSRILYPLRVDGWRAVSEQRYAQQAAGASVRYDNNQKQTWLDLYFYPWSGRGPDALAAVARAERDSIAATARASGRAAELQALERFRLPTAGAQGTDAWRLALAYPEERRGSAMVVFQHGMYLVKLRASATGAEPAAVLEAATAFVAALAPRIRIASTGGCWLPARVELVDGPLPDPLAAHVLASYREGQGPVAAVALADRVLAARSEQARAATLAQALAAALYPGCVAPEAIELDVPADLREIRIEYRAPDADPAPGGSYQGLPLPPRSATG